MMNYEHEWLTIEEVEKLFNVKHLPEKYEVWILLLYVPALRVSEAINVRVRDLNFDDACVDVWGGKRRRHDELEQAPCDVRTLNKIKRYVDNNKLSDDDYIMFARKSSKSTRVNVYLQANRLCGLAHIYKKVGATTFRRSRAQHLIDNGMDIITLVKFLRHRDFSSISHYIKTPTLEEVQIQMCMISDPIADIYNECV